jgi:hypothetical protein
MRWLLCAHLLKHQTKFNWPRKFKLAKSKEYLSTTRMSSWKSWVACCKSTKKTDPVSNR